MIKNLLLDYIKRAKRIQKVKPYHIQLLKNTKTIYLAVKKILLLRAITPREQVPNLSHLNARSYVFLCPINQCVHGDSNQSLMSFTAVYVFEQENFHPFYFWACRQTCRQKSKMIFVKAMLTERCGRSCSATVCVMRRVVEGKRKKERKEERKEVILLFIYFDLFLNILLLYIKKLAS